MYHFNKETEVLTIDNKNFVVTERDEETILLEPELIEVQSLNFTIADYPKNLSIEIHHESGFDTYLFHEVHLSKYINVIQISFLCLQPNKYWEGNWGLSTFLATLSDVIKETEDLRVESLNIETDWKELEVSFYAATDFNFKDQLQIYSTRLKELIKQAERILSGAVWRKEYESDEKLFSTEILYPLLRKMDFIDVRYTHGQREYGKDFTFSEQTKFGNLRHFGLQAKAGNIRGNVNSDIDEIIGQLNDSFSMPYHEVSANESRQISTFIVAISGTFTDNAKDKIVNKIPNYFKGSVYFLDRDKITELIERYWK